MSVEIVEDVKRVFICERCGKREVVKGMNARPQMGHTEVSIIIHKTPRSIAGKVAVFVCDSCASELEEFAERFFDESNKEEI